MTGLPVTTMVGILSGAVTNTPGLGAAQQAYFDMTGKEGTEIAMGYAVAYPLGVVGIIAALILIRYIFRISFDKETESAQSQLEEKEARATHVSVRCCTRIMIWRSLIHAHIYRPEINYLSLLPSKIWMR